MVLPVPGGPWISVKRRVEDNSSEVTAHTQVCAADDCRDVHLEVTPRGSSNRQKKNTTKTLRPAVRIGLKWQSLVPAVFQGKLRNGAWQGLLICLYKRVLCGSFRQPLFLPQIAKRFANQHSRNACDHLVKNSSFDEVAQDSYKRQHAAAALHYATTSQSLSKEVHLSRSASTFSRPASCA